MEHYLVQRDPAIFNINNEETLNATFNRFIDEVKGEIEAWSQRGWMIEGILAAFVNLALNEPFPGGHYMPLLKKSYKIRDNQCLRWALRADLFRSPRGKNPIRPGSYPTEDGLNFTGIGFPTPVSQVNKLEKQNLNLAKSVFGWEKDHVIVHRLSEQDGNIPRINLMLIQQGKNTHYSYVKKLTALLFEQSKHNNSKHFCERCLQTQMRRVAEKPERNGDAKGGGKQSGIHKLPTS